MAAEEPELWVHETEPLRGLPRGTRCLAGPADPDPGPSRTQVFALGNKTYEHFNAMGKYVDKRLEQLGAQRIFDLGLGDDDGK